MALMLDKVREKIVATESKRIQAVEESYKILCQSIDEYAENSGIDVKTLQLLKNALHDAFLERKASVYLEENLHNFNNYLQNILAISMKNTLHPPRKNKEVETMRILYFNKNNKILSKP